MAKPKILLLDPDLRNRSVLEISLKKSGFTVTGGEGATQAIEIIETFNPDLIISEISLEDHDGFWLCSQLVEKYEDQRPPFIFLTKHKRVEDKIRGLELGVEDYLVKPIYLREVVARVRILLEKKDKVQSAQAKPSGPLFQGDLEEMGVVDLLQTMELGNKTGIIQITHPRQNAQIFVQNGKVIHSVVGSFVGERAVYKLMQWTEGSFRIDFKKTIQVQPTISVSTQGLIMEGVRRIDEIERVKEQLPRFSARLVIDSEIILEEHPDRFPAKIENILAEFDGQKSIEDVVESLPYDDLESLEVIGKLFFQGFLVEAPDGLEEIGPDAEVALEVEDSPVVKGRDAPMLTSFGTIDLDNLDLGTSTSIEGIKAKARKPEDRASEKKSISRKAPVFDSLPGFDLAPPSQRVVESPTKAKQEPTRGAEPDLHSLSQSTSRSSRRRRIITNLDNDMPMAPPLVPPLRPSEEMDTQVGVGDNGLAPPGETAAEPTATTPQEQDLPLVEATEEVKIPARKASKKRKSFSSRSQHASETYELGNVLAVAPPVERMEPPQEEHRPAARAEAASLSKMPLFAGVLLVALLLGGGIFWQMSKTVTTAADYLAMAQRALDAGNLQLASEQASEALALSPAAVQARIILARVARREGRLQVAANQYRTALAREPTLYSDRLDYARVLFDQQESGSKLRALAEADRLLLDLSPLRERKIYTDALVFKLTLLSLIGRRAEMRVALGQLQAVDAAHPQLPLFESQVKDMEIQSRTAVPRVASIPVPTRPATVPRSRPRPKVSPKPSPVPAAPKKQKKAKAKTHPKASQKAKPKTMVKVAPKPKGPSPAEKRQLEAKAKYKKGLALYRKGYLKSSERELRAALSLAPDNAEVLIDLGRVYSELGQDRLALKHFIKAAQLDPRNPRSYINLGSVYMLMNNRRDAVQAYETYVRLMPEGSPEANEVRQILVKLRQRP